MTSRTDDRPTPRSSAADRGFLGHPTGLSTLFFVELWERFSYYGMRAILLYFLVDTAANGGLGIAESTGAAVVAIYGASVYLLSVIGGFAADRLVGARRSTLYGGLVIMTGHLCLAVPAAATAWLGIVLVALGTGLLKPNISTMVGRLYSDDDPRRDAGFSIFYMAINIGALLSPLVVAFLRNNWGYHAGFSAAAVGMAIALVWFVLGRRTLRGSGDDVPNPLGAEERGKVLVLGISALVAFVAVVLLAGVWRDTLLDQVIDAISIVAILVPIAYFTMMFRSPKVEAQERSHLAAYIPLWIGAMLFWMIFEQAAGKMALFASDNTVKQVAGVTIDPEWFQSVNPLAIIVLAPVFGWIWTKRAGRFPSTPMKFVLGVGLIGLSALAMSWAFATYQGNTAPVIVLTSVFVLQTVAELCLSPVGLSATTRLAPRAFTSQAMALWFLGSAAGQAIAAQLITGMADLPDSQYYAVLGIMTLAFTAVLFALVPWISRRMAAVERQAVPVLTH
ncbi:diguanylate cyclase [Intrasporangium oryzae NRRL B-24470]|uniref:Diguanylate cyclase n=1 Tax=Intrasporangium oryzae NRRL B-24470 TaxID=1386089 RepID=W9GES5_9MICO|nr:peptide MFS transporter [Intrasporangium oryzae]EWT02379.1 diguanylate cyclase [Intrasporangium oryzae NRRL B-24470]